MPSDFPLEANGGLSPTFIFATGFECSYPTVRWQGKTVRRDGYDLSKHYDHWRGDFELVKENAINFVRYSPQYYKVNIGRGHYDWSFPDETFRALRDMNIHVIVDLCHFGVPDWLENFQNPEFPRAFANFARAFAKRYPWLILYTPVNEIFITAEFSCLRGWWNERKQNDRAFVTALKHMCQATILAQQAILEVTPHALFVHSESTSYFHEEGPSVHNITYFKNQLRFTALDLIYGHDISGLIYEYLTDNGMTKKDYHWFLDNGRKLTPYCIMGNDYYGDNEALVKSDGTDGPPTGDVFGYYVLTKQYYDRYQLPVMHTETNRHDDENEAEKWLQKQWKNVVRLKQDGVPILGFTWYSLIDQTDWDTALREINFRTNPCGLYNKERQPRPVQKSYAQIIQEWRPKLPLNSLSRDIFSHLDNFKPQKKSHKR